ncbi:MAG: hypothetical protein ACHQUB_00185 [Candidatus Saccharimonadia bacterium]
MDTSSIPQPENATSTPQTSEYISNPFSATLHGLAEVLGSNPLPAILIGLVIVLSIVVLVLLELLFVVLGPVGAILAGILGLVFMIFVFPVTYGSFAYLYTASINKQSKKTGDFIKEGIKKAPSLLLGTILTFLAIMLGLILLVIPGLIFAAWFSLTSFVIVNENLSATAAMKRSHELVKGHIFEIWGSVFAAGILGSNGLLSFPVAASALGIRYEQLKNLKDNNLPKPPVHWVNYILPILGTLLIIGYIALITLTAVSSVQKNQNVIPNYSTTNSSTGL